VILDRCNSNDLGNGIKCDAAGGTRGGSHKGTRGGSYDFPRLQT
jgi:hypothetical protein